MLIDDDYLRQRQTGWPLRFAEQGRLLRQIASAGPSVILVDLVYPHRHGDDASSGGGDLDRIPPLNPIANTSDPTISGVPVVLTAMAKGLDSPASRLQLLRQRTARPRKPLDILDPESMPDPLRARLSPDGTGRSAWASFAGPDAATITCCCGGDHARAEPGVRCLSRVLRIERPQRAVCCQQSDDSIRLLSYTR